LRILHEEIDRVLGQVGCATVDSLDHTLLYPAMN